MKRFLPNTGPIDPGLSVMLDILRFGTAILVLVGHVSGVWLTGGWFWRVGVVLDQSVMIFFVLSGYVIAATSSRTTVVDYSSARLSRLYSVIVPALVITLICDAIGTSLNPHFYYVTAEQATLGEIDLNDTFVRYLTSFFMVNGYWVIPFTGWPGSNGPFWSLAFEATYYVAFAFMLFTRGFVRILCLALLFVLAGPRILILWPIWLLGFVLWHLRIHVPPRLGWPLIALGLIMAAGLVLTPGRAGIDAPFDHALSLRLFSDYWAALATAALILGLSLISFGFADKAARIAKPVRVIADHTFELYLIHFSVSYLAVALSPFRIGSVQHLFFVYGMVALVVIPVTRLTSPLKRWIRAHAKAPLQYVFG